MTEKRDIILKITGRSDCVYVEPRKIGIVRSAYASRYFVGAVHGWTLRSCAVGK
jgi:hypothetical protein